MHKRLLLMIICSGIISLSNVHGAGTKVLHARQYTTHQGLSNNEVTRIIQDRTGYIWIGTQNGLNRFNGYDFNIYQIDLTGTDNLPGNNVTSLYIDDYDSIWVGSSGLSLYRPETGNFCNWQQIPGDDMSLTDNSVNSIVNDRYGRIWIASYNGIRIIDRKIRRFTDLGREEGVRVNPSTIEYFLRSGVPVQAISRGAALLDRSFPDEQALMNALTENVNDPSYDEYFARITGEALLEWDENSLMSNHIVSLSRDINNNIWVVYGHEGVSCIDPETMNIRHYSDIVDDTGVAIDLINNIVVDGTDVWLATANEGLKKLNMITGEAVRVPLDGEPFIQHIRMEGKELWLADNRGVIVYDTETGRFLRKAFLIPNQGIMENFIGKYTFRDNQNNLWIGTSYTGLLMAVSVENFKMLENRIIPPVGNPENTVSSISFDRRNNLWVGYVGGGIEVFDQGHNRKFVVRRPGYHSARATDIFSIFPERENTVWTGSFEGGVEIYSENGALLGTLQHDGRPGGIPGNDIRDIRADIHGNIFLAVHGYGVAIINSRAGTTDVIRNNPGDTANTILSDWTQALYSDHGGVWIGTVDGLSHYSTEDGSVRNYRFGGDHRSFVNIKSIMGDSYGFLWLGTEYGVIIFNPLTGEYFRLTIEHGLSNSIITAVIEDKSDRIWVSTKTGLNRIEIPENAGDLIDLFKSSDPADTRRFITSYGLADGMLTDVFNFRACALSDNGHLYFGSSAGVVWFHPDSLVSNLFVPPVVISGLNLFNREVRIGDDTGILEKEISHTEKIVLKYRHRVVSLEFHALSFIYPEKNMYAYKMTGFDEDWTYVTVRREATYTNLNPGTYIFRVKAANNSGIWNEQGVSLQVVVRPPLFRTNAAYLFYALVILGLSYLLRQIIMIRTHAKMEVRKAQEIDEIKTNFFTNLSHEFRTPLTLIEGPVEKLMKEKERFDWNRDFYQVNLVYRNVQRLKLLITELMEFRRVAEGRRQLKVIRGDLPVLITDIKDAFDYLAGEKIIDFRLDLSHKSLDAWFDPGIIEKVLFNLLSNAFKYTPGGGRIIVKFKINRQSDELISDFYAREYIRIEITDTGPGIPEELREKIFERYYQAENRQAKTEGSGIGLALVRELVTLHKGEIAVKPGTPDSNPPGTSFIIKLPFGQEYYPGKVADEIYQGPDKEGLRQKTLALSTVKSTEDLKDAGKNLSAYTLLIIEDDQEVMQYLAGELKDSYRILSCSTAEEGLEIAFNEIPDLILTDIMLPGMDGIDLCRTIKSDLRTEHIPVILLTARSEEQDRLEGLETGADDFIIKPFVLEELKLRIKNSIQTRVKLQQRFLKEFTSTSQPINQYNADDRFLARALKIVNDNISSPGLDVDFFASEIGMSRAQLYRKFNALTSQTVKEFVRTVRLKKAAEMLDSGQYNVSEVAYAVGFGDLPYFTRSFKAQFGITPSKYSQKTK